jgi:gliding motility-associated-like protein
VKKVFSLLFFICFAASFSLGQTPSIHASSITFSNVYCEEMEIGWTDGNGSRRIVVLREGAAVNQTPVDGTFYTADDSFGRAVDIGGGNKVVYNGANNSTRVRGLKKNTTYHVAIFEYNPTPTYNYLISAGYAAGSQLTENITANFSIDQSYQCFYQNEFNFTNLSSNTEGSSLNYEWRMGDGQRYFTQNVTHSYVDGGIFDVELIARSTGCTDRLTLRDTVLVPFIVDFGLDETFAENDSIQCLEDNFFNYKNLFKKPTPIYGLTDRIRSTWTTSDGQSKNSLNAAFKFSASGLITVKLVQERNVSNGGLFCADSISKVYEVLPVPVVENQVSFSDTALCLNDNVFDFSHNAPDIVRTTWDLGDGNISTDNPTQHTYNQAGIFLVEVEVEDINGCTGTYLDSVEVFTPPNNFFTDLDSPYCIDNQPIDLIPNLQGGFFYGDNVDASANTFTPNTLGDFEIGYVYTQGNCVDTSKQFTTVLPRPNFSLGRDTLICPNTSLELYVPLDNVNITWSSPSNDSTLTITEGGLYWAEANNGQCSFRDSVDVRPIEPPTIEFSRYGDTTICGGQTIDLVVNADAGTATWSDGYIGFTRVVDESGTYEVSVEHPCGDATASTNINILPFACEIFIPNAFSPNGDNLNETFKPLGFFDFTRMEIFNEYGQLLYETESLEEDGWNGTYKGQEVMGGMYYYVIYYTLIEDGSDVKKVASGYVKLME